MYFPSSFCNYEAYEVSEVPSNNEGYGYGNDYACVCDEREWEFCSWERKSGDIDDGVSIEIVITLATVLPLLVLIGLTTALELKSKMVSSFCSFIILIIVYNLVLKCKNIKCVKVSRALRAIRDQLNRIFGICRRKSNDGGSPDSPSGSQNASVNSSSSNSVRPNSTPPSRPQSDNDLESSINRWSSVEVFLIWFFCPMILNCYYFFKIVTVFFKRFA